MTEAADQSRLAEAAEDWVTDAVSSPKKFDSEEEGATSPPGEYYSYS